ncbi:hypothetical protein DPMN_113510 [Dreissena polymorpha]|uniref:Uncharacterized protein n=1 Tax=Dreissena polymorpha TaxID=45954 RepID=A0A9D4KHM9_DREPO|nr:hypothetical protein DPMN_113510 [Dreissena polymorpha]
MTSDLIDCLGHVFSFHVFHSQKCSCLPCALPIHLCFQYGRVFVVRLWSRIVLKETALGFNLLLIEDSAVFSPAGKDCGTLGQDVPVRISTGLGLTGIFDGLKGAVNLLTVTLWSSRF